MNNTKTNKRHKVIGIWIMLSMIMTFTLNIANAAPIKIMFLGDSITEGDSLLPDNPDENLSTYTGTNPDAGPDGHPKFEDKISYRGALWTLLKDANYTFGNTNATPELEDETANLDFIGSLFKNSSTFQDANAGFDEHHEGHTGFTSKELLNGRDGDNSIDIILEANTPDVVLLHIGTNDSAEEITIPQTVDNVKDILDAIFTKNPQSKIFLARIIEARIAHNRSGGIVSDDNPQGLWNTKDLNDAVTTMATAHTHANSIKMVDMETALSYEPAGGTNDMQPNHETNVTETNNTADYHPTEYGYAKMAQKWFDAIQETKWLLPDTEKPVIALNGANPQQLAVGATYVELDANVTDNIDINLTATIGGDTVDTSAEGNYTVTYNAIDTAGNEAVEVNRTVVVSTAPDTEKPVITLTGTPSVEVAYAGTYTDAGATANDVVDGDITANITTVNPVSTNTAGTYTVTYNVKDAAGNPAVEVKRTVIVGVNPADDADGNGIPDNLQKDWFTYDKPNQTAMVGPATAQSELKVDELLTPVSTAVTADAISLEYTDAYMKANTMGEVTTGFKTGDKSTLKAGTSYVAGTKSIIKKEGEEIIIESSAKLAKDTSIVMGDK